MGELRPAATVVLLSDDGRVFLVQRHRKMGFLPSAWVFPGGRVGPTDRLADHPRVLGGERVVTSLGIDREDAISFLVAAVRETFEETGIWLGSGTVPQELRAPLDRREIALADVLDEHDATLNLDRMVPWSWWITPEAEPKRYDTRFFVARADGVSGAHDERETVDSGWFRPEDVLAEAAHERFPMAPPTWWTLQELAALADTDVVLESSWSRDQEPILPVMTFEEGFSILLPGHEAHEEPGRDGLPVAIRFADGRWVAEGS